MATVPGPNAVDPRSTDGNTEDRRFERLERVRALQRSRRHRRLVLVATLVLMLAAGSVLGFTAVRRVSSGNNLERSGVQAPVASPASATLPPATEAQPTSPAPDATNVPPAVGAPAPVTSPAPGTSTPTVDTTRPSAKPSAQAPARAEGTDRAKAEVALPRRSQPEAAPAAGVTPSAGRETVPRASVRSEPSSREADPTAAIDWLLGTSRAKGQ